MTPNFAVKVAAIALVALVLAGCGRRGPLEPPPGAPDTRSTAAAGRDVNADSNAANGPDFGGGAATTAAVPVPPALPGVATSPASAGQPQPTPRQTKTDKDKKDVPPPPQGRSFILDPLL